MKKSFAPATWLYPQPALVIGTFDESGMPNAMVAAWGGIYDTNKIGFMLDHRHKTTKNLLAKKAFTVSPATEGTMESCDYVGIVSGEQVADKTVRAGFKAVRSDHVDAPVFEELPLTLECKVEKIVPEGEDYYFVGEIVNILADEDILTDGKPDPAKLKPLVFDAVRGQYIGLGEVAGKAFSVGRKLIIK